MLWIGFSSQYFGALSLSSTLTSPSVPADLELNFKCPRKGYEYLCNGIISLFISNKFAKLSQICFVLCHNGVWSVD